MRSPVGARGASTGSESKRNLQGFGVGDSHTGDVVVEEQSLPLSSLFHSNSSLQLQQSPTSSSTDLSIIEFGGPADAGRSTANEREPKRGTRVLLSLAQRHSQSERNLRGQPPNGTAQPPRRRLSRSNERVAEDKVPERRYRRSDRHSHSSPAVISQAEELEPARTVGPSEGRERRQTSLRKHRSSPQLPSRRNSLRAGDAAPRRATMPCADERQPLQRKQSRTKAAADPKRPKKQTSLPCTVRERSRSRLNVDIIHDGCAGNQNLPVVRRPSLPREIPSTSSLRSYLDKLSAMKQAMKSDKSIDSSGLDIAYSPSSLQQRSQQALASATYAGLLPSSQHTSSPTVTDTAESTEHTLSPFPQEFVQKKPALPLLDPSILSPPLAQTKSLSMAALRAPPPPKRQLETNWASPDITIAAPPAEPPAEPVYQTMVGASPCLETSSVGSMASDIESLIQASPRNKLLELDGDSILSYSPTRKYSGDDAKVSPAVATHVPRETLENFQILDEKSAHSSLPHMKTDAHHEKNNVICITTLNPRSNPTETGGTTIHASLRKIGSRRKCINRSSSVPCLNSISNSPTGNKTNQPEVSRSSGISRRRPSEIRSSSIESLKSSQLSHDKEVKAEIRTRRASDLGVSSHASNIKLTAHGTNQHQIQIKDSTPTMHRNSQGRRSGRSSSRSRRNCSDIVNELRKTSSPKGKRYRKRANSEGRNYRGRCHRKQSHSSGGDSCSPNDRRSSSLKADRKNGTRKSRSKSRSNTYDKKLLRGPEHQNFSKSLACLALECLPGGSPSPISGGPVYSIVTSDDRDGSNPTKVVGKSTQTAIPISAHEDEQIKPITMIKSTPQPELSYSDLGLAAATNQTSFLPKLERACPASTIFGTVFPDPLPTPQARSPKTNALIHPAQSRILHLNELVFPNLDDSRRPPQRTVSDITDDPLFRKLTLAGISEEQLARMNLFGLKVTET